MDKYEYATVRLALGSNTKSDVESSSLTLISDESDELEDKETNCKEEKNTDILSTFKYIVAVITYYRVSKENSLEIMCRSNVFQTKHRVYCQNRLKENVSTYGYFMPSPEQLFNVLVEVFAKLGAEGWHVIEKSKLGDEKNLYGVAILERRLVIQ